MAQLAATGIMALLRAVIRRGIFARPTAIKLKEHFELDWLARAILGKPEDLSPSTAPKSNPERAQQKTEFELKPSFRVVTGGDPIPEPGKFDETMPLIRNRQSLGRLSHWKDPVSRPAVATASAIEIVMNTLFADGEENENALEATHFSWDLDVQFKDLAENKGNGPRD
jgi:hypothetical protein